jgi:hypothetical protein
MFLNFYYGSEIIDKLYITSSTFVIHNTSVLLFPLWKLQVLLMTLQNAPPGLDYDRDKGFSKVV